MRRRPVGINNFAHVLMRRFFTIIFFAILADEEY
jgi:hypothetical protein